ncbi:MAG: hypothetical protein OXF40_06140 [Rhodospirillales bacterium]|nr:hypothetical protein [Rhodospirillales bacterium]
MTRRTFVAMRKPEPTPPPMPDVPDRPDDWREQIKVDLAAQVEAGGTLYGFRPDGAWIVHTRDGTRVVRRPTRQTA